MPGKRKYHTEAEKKAALARNSKRWRERHPELFRSKNNKWRDRNPERWALIVRRHELQKRYGLSLEAFEAIWALQNGRCALNPKHLLSREKRGAVVDHCHKSGKVRQLLCPKCNLLLGHADDDIETLSLAIAYLTRHKGEDK